MDDWPESQGNRKRSFAEMSQSATLSPSPVLFHERPSNFGISSATRFPNNTRDSLSNPNSSFFLDRRPRQLASIPSPPPNPPRRSETRNSHISRPSTNMEEANLRSSGLVIDLTSEPDDIVPPPPRHGARITVSRPPVSRPPRPPRINASREPPRLGRSDAGGLWQVVDLTGDDDDEDDTIVITHSRERSAPRMPQVPGAPRPRFTSGRMDSPRLDARDIPSGIDFVRRMEQPRGMPGRAISGGMRAIYNGGGEILVDIQNYMGFGRANLGGDDLASGNPPDYALPVMPNLMDYGRVALQEDKPNHVPPSPVAAGFTRSPQESDTAICPSCEEELVHRKEGEEPVNKKSRGVPTRRDREEHPFWVVKDCGHVFCNKCFQHRSNTTISSFCHSTPRKILCSVDNCNSDVKGKDKWVGVFL